MNWRAHSSIADWFELIYILISIGASLLDFVIGMSLLSTLLTLALLIPSISIAARRLHDTGRSGWWQLIALIPLIGWIVLLVFLVQDSHGDNEYGPSPKANLV